MPFWWRRRRRPWFGRRRKRFTFRRYKTRRRRIPRRRTRRPYRRRRRKRRKVRRKRRKLNIQQWQPDSIRKCKIIGVGNLVVGAQGKQLLCYTTVKAKSTPAKAPMGGGFGVEKFTMSYLYEEHIFRNNIWTCSNIVLDLVRYLGVEFTFYRHQNIDFVIQYERQPPFEIQKDTYMLTHPQQMLLQKHKIVLLSTKSKPNGKIKKKKFIRPPKQMITKWFFQNDFAPAALLLLRGAAADFRFSYLGCCNTNQEVSFFYLNTDFYQNGNWGAQSTTAYLPYNNIPSTLNYKVKDKSYSITKPTTTTSTHSPYDQSVSYENGYFQPTLLQATEITNITGLPTATLPLNVSRYNPNQDSGRGNKIYLTSILTTGYDPPLTDLTVLIQEVPLWLGLYGYLSWITTIKKDKTFLQSHCVVLQSPAIYPYAQIGVKNFFIPIDETMVNGKAPYDEYLTKKMKQFWYPSVQHQIQTLNAIVTAGPYIPKLANTKESTWELKYSYKFYLKLGGPQITDNQIVDPKAQHKYPTPDTIYQTIQIKNPAKQTPESILQPWDYRRGVITKSALKRIRENIETDTDFEPISEHQPPKKKERKGAALTLHEEEEEDLQACLQSLCEENIFQETQEPQTLKQLIMEQQQYQHNLKYNLLKVLSEMKAKQRQLQLQTGLFN
nr:MAG: ORF1 [Torque teno midi virus]